MAAAREENPYEGGVGTGGKFRKKPSRRTTPYDRPPTALRNTNSNGWLSKLVDPAQKLITSGAHKLFSTVFRKRLPPPPPPHPPSQEAREDTENKNQEAVRTDFPGVRGAIDVGGSPSNTSNGYAASDLEQILKQKTFTRSEIDRLTALLQSQTVDIPKVSEGKSSELIPSTPVVSHARKENFLKTPAQEDGVGSQLIASTPLVLDEYIASPLELAKAYMGSRPSKVCSSMVGFRSQMLGEETASQGILSLTSKSYAMSLLPKPASRAAVQENGFLTPRSRGRSALYSMARTPYSRVHATTNNRIVGSTIDAYGGPSPSSSKFAWEQATQSNPGALKRRSSVLDDDIGSVGPIRRIRHKTTAQYSKGLSLPVSGGPISVQGKRVGFDDAQRIQPSSQSVSSSIRNPLLLGVANHNSLRSAVEKGDNAVPSTSVSSVPSRSSEMALKILEQLDKLTPPKEKSSELKFLKVRNTSPTKLSPSMLRGSALKSLEEVDSSKYLENVEDNKRLNDSDGVTPQDFSSRQQDKIEETKPSKLVPPSDRSTSVVNGVSYAASSKDNVASAGVSASTAFNSDFQPQKMQTFRMSAHEDFLDLDGGLANGTGPHPLGERTEVRVESEGPRVFSGAKPSVFSILNHNAVSKSGDVSAIPDKNTSSVLTIATSSTRTVQATTPESSSTISNDALPNELKAGAILFSSSDKLTSQQEPTAAAPKFTFGDVPLFEQKAVSAMSSFGEKASPPKQPTASDPLIFGDKGATYPFESNAESVNGGKAPQQVFKVASSFSASESVVAVERGSSSGSRPENSGSFPLVSGPATSSVEKVSVSFKADNNNTSKAGGSFGSLSSALSSSAAPSASAGSMFTFGLSAASNSNLNNGFFASSPSLFSSPSAPVTSNNVASDSSSSNLPFSVTTTNSNPTFSSINNSSLSTSAPAPSFPAAPTFKFGFSTTPSTSASPLQSTSSTVSLEPKLNQDTNSSNSSSTFFSGISSTNGSTGSSVFGFNAVASSSNVNNQSQGSTQSTSIQGTSLFGSSSSTPGTSLFGSSSLTPSFGLGGNTSFSSGPSLFGSSTSAPTLFSSNTVFGAVCSSSSEATSIGSSSGATTSLFGSSWQPPTSPIFGSTLSTAAPTPSTGFSFSASASAAPTNIGPALFGSSSGASSSSMFPFTSSAAITSTQPLFGNQNNPFGFNTAPSSNNDQMSVEDSMAEDTVHTMGSPTPGFGQQPVSTPPSVANHFQFSSTPSVANPFQFSSQPNLASPQIPNPFQPSVSPDFNAGAGGSFSLGAGGGDKSNRRIVKLKPRPRKK